MSKFRGVKTDNGKTNLKIDIRKRLINKIDDPRVIEFCCGSGVMFRNVWSDANDYLGIDKKKFFDDRKTICGDAKKSISMIDVCKYNIYDVDTYGSPYEILYGIVNRLAGNINYKNIGFVLTDGSNMDLKMGRISKGIRQMTGLNFHVAKKVNKIHDEIIIDIINNVVEKLNGTLIDRVIYKKQTTSAMRYICFSISFNDVV